MCLWLQPLALCGTEDKQPQYEGICLLTPRSRKQSLQMELAQTPQIFLV